MRGDSLAEKDAKGIEAGKKSRGREEGATCHRQGGGPTLPLVTSMRLGYKKKKKKKKMGKRRGTQLTRGPGGRKVNYSPSNKKREEKER